MARGAGIRSDRSAEAAWTQSSCCSAGLSGTPDAAIFIKQQEFYLSRPQVSVTKRQREQKKRDKREQKAQKKAERPNTDGSKGAPIEEQEIYYGDTDVTPEQPS